MDRLQSRSGAGHKGTSF
ncbi:hypothetical protein SAMN05216367_3360 [Tardiphaga sp. OK245]|nr:hypothetical protein SAMN05216367_3360 [Tardiphaga sp. OK245]SNT15645.1 hypothetical protein SAMN05216374_2966 [Tardiphaga sp. OK246]